MNIELLSNLVLSSAISLGWEQSNVNVTIIHTRFLKLNMFLYISKIMGNIKSKSYKYFD